MNAPATDDSRTPARARRPSLRTVVFWTHLCAGVGAAVVVLVMSVTGVLLAYEKQMIRWFDGYNAPPSPAASERLPLEAILERAAEARPGQPGNIVVRRDPAAPVEVAYGRDGSLFFDAYTGSLLGSGSATARAFFRSTMEWHRWLAMKDDSRPIGKQITGVSNLVFLFITVSGFYLWWPRSFRWAQFRQVLWFRRGLSSKARDFNWHHVIGYWSLVPLVVIIWSGVVIGYPWASNLTYRMVGEAPPQRAAQAGPVRSGAGGADAEVGDASAARPYRPLEAMVQAAQQRAADWTILTLRVPNASDSTVQVTVDTGTGAQPQKKATLMLDRATGAEKAWEPFEAQSRGRQWRSWMRFVHTGEYYGLTGQTIAMVVTAGSIVLVWTGLALTWRRFTAWRARAATRSARIAA